MLCAFHGTEGDAGTRIFGRDLDDGLLGFRVYLFCSSSGKSYHTTDSSKMLTNSSILSYWYLSCPRHHRRHGQTQTGRFHDTANRHSHLQLEVSGVHHQNVCSPPRIAFVGAYPAHSNNPADSSLAIVAHDLLQQHLHKRKQKERCRRSDF